MASLLQSMTEYDYINDATDVEEKRQLVKQMVDNDRMNKADLKSTGPGSLEPLEGAHLEIGRIHEELSVELERQPAA